MSISPSGNPGSIVRNHPDHPSLLPLTEGKLRSRQKKGFGPFHTASVTETGLELGAPDFPGSFGPGHFLGKEQGRRTGEVKERVGGLGIVRQEGCGAQLTADKRPTMPFRRDILSRCNFPAADTIFFLM